MSAIRSLPTIAVLQEWAIKLARR